MMGKCCIALMMKDVLDCALGDVHASGCGNIVCKTTLLTRSIFHHLRVYVAWLILFSVGRHSYVTSLLICLYLTRSTNKSQRITSGGPNISVSVEYMTNYEPYGGMPACRVGTVGSLAGLGPLSRSCPSEWEGGVPHQSSTNLKQTYRNCEW